jgi:AcrR family transcriptional regulator
VLCEGKEVITLIAEASVQEMIIHSAKEEFLQHGYKDASLRNIAAASGMTTGAIYTYFKDKNALFEAIVDPVYSHVERLFSELSESYYTAEAIVGDISPEKSMADLNQVYSYIYDNFDLFRLLVVGAEGSSRADFIHSIVDCEVNHTLAYLEKWKDTRNVTCSKISRAIIHTISEGYINVLLEPVRHNQTREEALKNIEVLVVFYTGGWKSVFNAYCDTDK